MEVVVKVGLAKTSDQFSFDIKLLWRKGQWESWRFPD